MRVEPTNRNACRRVSCLDCKHASAEGGRYVQCDKGHVDVPKGIDECSDFEHVAEQIREHEWDEDGVCIHCGFDGAEHYWWKSSTAEGRAMKTPEPACVMRSKA